MASFQSKKQLKWIDYTKRKLSVEQRFKQEYCEDQASNDLTAEEKQDARDYLENYIKT